jgi:hypothetical protein
MIFSETIHETDLDAGLHALTLRGTELLKAHSFTDPVRCKLTSLDGQIVGEFDLANEHMSHSREIARFHSLTGVRMELTDSEGKIGEIVLLIHLLKVQ